MSWAVKKKCISLYPSDFWHFTITILRVLCDLASAHLSRLIFYHCLDIYDPGTLNFIICPKFTMPFYTSVSLAEAILSACKIQSSPRPLYVPKQLLNFQGSTWVSPPLGGLHNTVVLPPHSWLQKSSLYIPIVPWASLYPRITLLYWSYPLINIFLHPDNKFRTRVQSVPASLAPLCLVYSQVIKDYWNDWWV